jgi:hypothetical protein
LADHKIQCENDDPKGGYRQEKGDRLGALAQASGLSQLPILGQ